MLELPGASHASVTSCNPQAWGSATVRGAQSSFMGTPFSSLGRAVPTTLYPPGPAVPVGDGSTHLPTLPGAGVLDSHEKCQGFLRHSEQALSRALGQAVAVGLLSAVHSVVGSSWVPQGGTGVQAEGQCPGQPG